MMYAHPGLNTESTHDVGTTRRCFNSAFSQQFIEGLEAGNQLGQELGQLLIESKSSLS